MAEPQINLSSLESQEEEWRIIVDFPDYEVSSHGRVRRRFDHPRYRTRYRAGHILRPSTDEGYHRLELTKDGAVHDVRVHRLVAQAFLPPPGAGQIWVNHKDGNPSNNFDSNLEWATPLENQRHAIEVLGKHRSGESSSLSKLTDAEVREIHEMRMSGMSPVDIARQFNVTEGCVYAILERKNRSRQLPETADYPSIRGKKTRGSGNGSAKLTEDQVREIKKLISQGVNGRKIAKMFNAHPQTVSNIKNEKSWTHVD